MAHIVLFRFRGSGEERAALREALPGELGSSILAIPGAPAELLLHVGIDEPRDLGLYREGDDFTPPWDLAIRGEFADSDALGAVAAIVRAAAPCELQATYRVDPFRVKRGGVDDVVGRVPGILMLHPVFFHEDLSRSALLRSWREIHADLAVKVHVGVESYTQLLVEEKLGDGPDYGGFSSLHFPSREALMTGYFDSDRGRAEIRHDIRHFIRGIPPRMFGTLYRYRN